MKYNDSMTLGDTLVKHKTNDYLSPLQVLRLIATAQMKQSPLDDVTLLGYKDNYDIVICRNNVKVYSHSKETTLCNEYYLEEIVNLEDIFEEEEK